MKEISLKGIKNILGPGNMFYLILSADQKNALRAPTSKYYKILSIPEAKMLPDFEPNYHFAVTTSPIRIFPNLENTVRSNRSKFGFFILNTDEELQNFLDSLPTEEIIDTALTVSLLREKVRERFLEQFDSKGGDMLFQFAFAYLTVIKSFEIQNGDFSRLDGLKIAIEKIRAAKQLGLYAKAINELVLYAGTEGFSGILGVGEIKKIAQNAASICGWSVKESVLVKTFKRLVEQDNFVEYFPGITIDNVRLGRYKRISWKKASTI